MLDSFCLRNTDPQLPVASIQGRLMILILLNCEVGAWRSSNADGGVSSPTDALFEARVYSDMCVDVAM